MKKYILTSLLLLIVSFSHAQVPNYVPTNGLVGWWPFNGNANDESGNGNNGTVNGATLTTDRFGVANKAYNFDGVNDFISFSTNSVFNILNDITISCWSQSINSLSNQVQLVWFGDDQPARDPYSIAISSSNLFYFRKDVSTGSTTRQVNSSESVNTNYCHIVGTYNVSANKMKIYINGLLQDSINVDFSINYATQNMILNFASSNNGFQQFFNGNLDDIGIWNRALTQQEITNLYNPAVPPPPPTANITPSAAEICVGASTTLTASASTSSVSACASSDLSATLQNGLVGYWPFCGNANDASGNGNNGMVNGATLTSDRFGNANSAYSFDGVDDNILLQMSSYMAPNNFNHYAVSFWFNWEEISNSGRILQFHEGISGNTSNYDIVVNENNTPQGTLSITHYLGNTSTVSPNTIVTNNWNQCYLIFNHVNNTFTCFLNGISWFSGSLGNNHPGQGLLSIGSQINNFSTFLGKLDDIAIWNRALTAAEIQQLYTQGQTTYSWSPGGATTPSITVSPTSTTTYTCTATVNGQTATASQTITLNPLPAVNAGIDVNVCTGNSTTLSGSGASTYAWDNNVTNGVAFTPATSGTYTVTGTDANGCVNSDQVLVTVNSLPNVNAGIDQIVCAGVPVTLNGAGAATYSWNNNVTNGVPFFPVSSGTFTVTGTGANGCTANDQVMVTIIPLPLVNAGADQAVCAGTSVTLNGSGATTYSWNNGVVNGVAFTPNTTTTYSLTGTNQMGCTWNDQVVVTVNALPTVNAGSDQMICAGTAITLNGSGASTYAWDNNVSNGVAFTPTASGTYTVTGTNANGCTNSDQVFVMVHALPTVNAGADQSVCAGTAVTLSASGATSYAWNNNVSNAVAFTPTASGTYSVTGTDGNGCTNTDQVAVTVNLLPSVNAGADQSICKGAAVTLSGTGATSYAWNNNVTNGVVFNPIATATYSVSGTDANGCTNADEVIVTVNEASASTLTESAMDSYTLNGQTYTQSGTYTQTLTNAAGCDSIITLNLTLSFTGLGELAQGIRIFPNPANDVLNIESTSPLIGEYVMNDAAGRVILNGTFTGMTTSIDVRNIAPGTYTLQAKELLERIVVLRR